MSDSPITRLTSTTNATVVQLPGRQHPGVVVQGDSLENLSALLDDVAANLQRGDTQEALGVVAETREILAGYLDSLHASTAAKN